MMMSMVTFPEGDHRQDRIDHRLERRVPDAAGDEEDVADRRTRKMEGDVAFDQNFKMDRFDATRNSS